MSSPFLSDNIAAFRGLFGADITDQDIVREINRLKRVLQYRRQVRATERLRARGLICPECGRILHPPEVHAC